MTSALTISGADQIAALTEQTTLPLPQIPKVILELLVDLIHDVWARMRKVVPGLNGASEPQITTRFQTEMTNSVRADPLLQSVISTIVQSPNLPNYDGKKLAKQPDLAIYLNSRHLSFPLAIECKIIHRKGKKTVDLYGREGMARFINGDYSWASREAIMLAYVKDESDLKDDLLTLLDDATCLFQRLPHPNSWDNGDPKRSIAETFHTRAFEYRVKAGNKQPGPISLLHLWLSTR